MAVTEAGEPKGQLPRAAFTGSVDRGRGFTDGRLDPVARAEGQLIRFEDAYGALFVRAQRCAFRLLGDRDAAEDVAAEAMARAFARWSKIGSYADAWVTRVAANLALDTLRRKSPRSTGPADGAEGNVDRLMLRGELAKLPRRQREAIVLRYLLDFDEDETARTLGIGVASVHTHVQRGLARMRAVLGEADFGGDR